MNKNLKLSKAGATPVTGSKPLVEKVPILLPDNYLSEGSSIEEPPKRDPYHGTQLARTLGQLLRLKRSLGAKYFNNEVKVGYLADVVQVTRSFPDHDSLHVVWYSDRSRVGARCIEAMWQSGSH